MPIENGERIKIHEDISILKTEVKEIKENDLVHIQNAVSSLNNKVWAIIMLLVANLVGLVISLIK